MKNNFLKIENKAGKIKLNDNVDKDSADLLIGDLEKLYGESAVEAKTKIGEVVCSADNALKSVEVEINSNGGSVFEGQRIYNALRQMSARGVTVETVVNGIAASMGSVIMMAGDTRKITQGSRVMIHEASTSAWGDARELKRNAELLESISAEIADVYAERSGGDAEAIRNLMLDETWLTANEAKELGFVQTVIKDGKDSSGLKSNLFTNQKQNMGIFTNEKELKDKLEVMTNDATELENNLKESKEQVKNLTESVTSFKTESVDLKGKLEASEVKVKDLEASLTESKGKLEESESKQSEFDAKVANAALAKLAEMGTPEPIASEDSDNSEALEAAKAAVENAKDPKEKYQAVKNLKKLQIN